MVTVIDLEFPEDRFYHKEHSWAKEQEGLIAVGIDEFTGKAAGKIAHVRVFKPGRQIAQGKSVGRGAVIIISLILKLIALIFLIFFLFILPFFYYGLATTTAGVSYAGIGAIHSFNAFEELSDPLDPDINFDQAHREHSQS